jgi:hypothetical protein
VTATSVFDNDERFAAVLYHNGRVRELGSGEAFDVTAGGVAVGSDRPPIDVGPMTDAPHAILWRDARTVRLAPQARESVAYAIDASYRVIGALVGSDGRHYAFLWERNRLHLLDELAPHRGWRFEGAYRFTADGGIVGIGTHDGVASAYILHVPRYL